MKKTTLIIAIAVLTTTIASVAYAINNITPQASSNCATIENQIEQLCVQSVTPSTVNSSGLTTININGTGFPGKSHTTDYVQSGLVNQFDGINNEGTGDAYHNANLRSWTDLKTGQSFPFNVTDSTMSFTPNALYQTGGNTNDGILIGNFPALTSNDNMFFEVTYMLPNNVNNKYIFGTYGVPGSPNDRSKGFGLNTNYYNKLNAFGFVSDAGIDIGPLQTAGQLHTMTFSYNGSSKNLKVLVDGVVTHNSTKTYRGNVAGSMFLGSIGTYLPTGDYEQQMYMYSFRYYNRILTDQEVADNYNVDKLRFYTPPTATIKLSGQQGDLPCANLVIISDELMQCTAPAINNALAPILADVTVNYGGQSVTLQNGYEYKNATITSVFPSIGPATGGNEIVINGESFPHTSYEMYEQNGLVAHFDGINNVGFGDENHDDTATYWKDIKNDLYVPKYGAGGHWTNSGYVMGDGSDGGYFYVGGAGQNVLPTTYPLANTDRSIEIVWKNPTTNYVLGQAKRNSLFSYGAAVCSGGNERKRTSYYYQGNNIDFNGCWNDYVLPMNVSNPPAAISDLYTANKLNTSVATYSQDPSRNSVKMYANGVLFVNSATSGNQNNTQRDALAIGGDVSQDLNISSDYVATGYEIKSVRLYNRVLSDAEVANNRSLDVVRYTSPPQVILKKTGQADKACTDVVVLSNTQIKCTAPAGTAGDTGWDIVYKNGTYETKMDGVYSYASASQNVVSKIVTKSAPVFVNPANENATVLLKLQGAFPSSVSSIKIGGIICSDITQTSVLLTCKVGALANSSWAGIKDIVIVATANTITLASAFEYTAASVNPISYKVTTIGNGFRLTNPAITDLSSIYSLASSATVDSEHGAQVDPNWVAISSIDLKVPTDLNIAYKGTNITTYSANIGNYNFVCSAGDCTIKLALSGASMSSVEAQTILNSLNFTGGGSGASSGTGSNGGISIKLNSNFW